MPNARSGARWSACLLLVVTASHARPRSAPGGAAAATTGTITTVPRLQADSVRILITNDMPHPMTLSYEVDGAKKPTGTVEGGAERTITLRGLEGDSVTVWAVNDDPPHQLSHRFPTHSTTPLTWGIGS